MESPESRWNHPRVDGISPESRWDCFGLSFYGLPVVAGGFCLKDCFLFSASFSRRGNE